jgi:hypothetical protein
MRRFVYALALMVAALCATDNVRAGDREMAQSIAGRIRDSGQVKDYSIGVKYKDGVAWLSGQVSNKQQMGMALKIARQTRGVDRVVNRMSVNSNGGPRQGRSDVRQTAYGQDSQVQQAMPQAQMPQAPAPQQAMPRARMPRQGMSQQPLPIRPPMRDPRMASNAGMPVQMSGPMPAMQGAPGGGPLPTYVGGTGQGVNPAVYDQPNMPDYAWPAYAAHPNYAAVTYPRQYSPTAWPYIGPFYPYPQVPLGWRKVCLEWDDGWWFLDFND